MTKHEKALYKTAEFLSRWLASFEMNQRSIHFKLYQFWLLCKLNWYAWRANIPAEDLITEVLRQW